MVTSLLLSKTMKAPLKAVIFDIGGVVSRSPFTAIAAYEQEKGIPRNYLNCSIVARGPTGAWQRFERGQIDLFQFYKAFQEDLSDTINGNVWYADYCRKRGIACSALPETLDIDGRELFGRMMRETQHLDERFIEAIKRIKASGRYKVIALTNNYSKALHQVPQSELEFLGCQDGAAPMRLRALFDDFCDSSEMGVRKPELKFYQMACERNGLRPAEAVFLDDIRLNLKAARQLGMDTIHVPIGRSVESLRELEEKIGIDLGIEEEVPASQKGAKL